MVRKPRMAVMVQEWEQIEEGLKTAEAGYSLHASEKDRVKFIRAYWESLPEEPPRVFVRPAQGKCYLAYISTALYDEIRRESFGKRFEGAPPEKL